MLEIPCTQVTLDNGLDVIVHEDHHAPLVAVSVWYHVGSKNEVRGRTGLAHLFEHLMFEGSAHQPSGYFGPLQEAGASLNGSTNPDRTNYWEVVPSGAARLALWMEADRMGWLLPALSAERFEAQRGVVLNERRQSYENRPYGLAQFVIARQIYPREHPYSWPTIGDPADLRAASVEDARAFFARHYHPGNASLAIAGDITTAEALDLAQELFGAIAPGETVNPVTPPRTAPQAARLALEDRVELPRLYLAWPSAALFADGDAELDLAADLIANGRTSRLYSTLIHDRRVATELAASQGSREVAGHFQIMATAAPGHSLEDLESAIFDAIGAFATAGPTEDELARGRIQAESAFVGRLQTLGGFGGKTDQLNAYNVYRGTPDYVARDLQRYLDATPAGVRAAVSRWIDPGAAVALSVVPAGRLDLALPGSAPVTDAV